MKRFYWFRARSIVLLTFSGLIGRHVQAQHHQLAPPTGEHDSLVEAFVDRARKATDKYHDLNAAIAAGYRLVGPDFPGMGEHWVHTSRTVQRDLSVEHPAILSYVRIDGEPFLLGVGYTHPVQTEEEPPDFVLPGLWHYHSGTVDEETLLLNPRAMDHDSEDQPRLAMFHAWIWTENPDGLFAQDNWALPFLRLGLPVPSDVPPQAGKALFLLSGDVEYYGRLVEVAGEPDQADRAAVTEIMERYYRRVQTRYEALRKADEVTTQDLEKLTSFWHDMWTAVEKAVGPALWVRIQKLAG